MTGTPLNERLIYPGNDCFGCGPDNPEGLRIEIYRDGDRTDHPVREELALSAEIVKEAEGESPFSIRTTIRDRKGDVPSEAGFDYVLLPHEKFQHVAGLDRLPDHYLRHFGAVS